MTEIKGKYAGEVMRYVDAVIDGRIVAGEDRVLACRRFARMAASGEYDIRTRTPTL